MFYLSPSFPTAFSVSRFNRIEHYDYEGEVPAEDWFIDEFSSPSFIKQVAEFRESYSGRTYSFRKQIHKYLLQVTNKSLKMEKKNENAREKYLPVFISFFIVFPSFQDIRLLRSGCLYQLEEFFTFQEELSRKAGVPCHAFSFPFYTSSSLAHALFR